MGPAIVFVQVSLFRYARSGGAAEKGVDIGRINRPIEMDWSEAFDRKGRGGVGSFCL